MNYLLEMGFQPWQCKEALLAKDSVEEAVGYIVSHLPDCPVCTFTCLLFSDNTNTSNICLSLYTILSDKLYKIETRKSSIPKNVYLKQCLANRIDLFF